MRRTTIVFLGLSANNNNSTLTLHFHVTGRCLIQQDCCCEGERSGVQITDLMTVFNVHPWFPNDKLSVRCM